MQPVTFDGNWPHATMEFTGTRYARMGYAGKGTDNITERLAKEIGKLGFRPRWTKCTKIISNVLKAGKECLVEAEQFINKVTNLGKAFMGSDDLEKWGSA